MGITVLGGGLNHKEPPDKGLERRTRRLG